MNKIFKIIDARNALLIVSVLLVAGFIGLWVPYQQSKQPADTPIAPTGEAEVIVEYAKSGFKPETITVPAGTTVAWNNTSGRPMWVASDPHPAHTDLKGFDQLRVINRAIPSVIPAARAHGEGIYEYTFTKLGTWKYHNHLNPAHLGAVIVIENK
ncbi:MAG TPA: hypothetical protein VNA68_01070 [Candidatus Dormibacteraeota bacterium]|nr:hypothetical protein [Candidatus Dormibacteraeota bacterium]